MRVRVGERVVAVMCLAILATCDWLDGFEICDPREGRGRVGFYSTGDCEILSDDVFLGHEWITYLGNQDPDDRSDTIFTDDQVADIIEGNRHVDYPIELLVHLENGPVAYVDALNAYHNDPGTTVEHFMLNDRMYTYEAWHKSLCWIRARTIEAVAAWNDNQLEALTKMGQACHTLQDSFSLAHSDRLKDDPTPWCIRQLSYYTERQPGFDGPNPDPDAPDYNLEIKFHNRLQESEPGHTTAQDSIYIEDSACLHVADQDEVEACLKEVAKRAVVATRDYLTLVRELATTSADIADIDAALAPYIDEHFPLCKPPPGQREPCD